MDDFEVRFDELWFTFQDRSEGNFWDSVVLSSEADGVYEYEWTREAGYADNQTWDIKVNDILIEEDLSVPGW